MKAKWVCVLFVSLFLLLTLTQTGQEGSSVQAQTAPTPCPECINDLNPLPGHGTAHGDRRILNIFLAEGWDSAQQRQNVSEALECARGQWNGTDDFNGRALRYDIRITTDRAQADIVVEGGVTASGCGRINVGSYPNTIRLGHITRANAVEHICGSISHELGHGMRLANDDSCLSIMNAVDGNCINAERVVTPNDIFRVNQHFETQPLCTTNLANANEDVDFDPCEGDPNCGDPCGGDPCCGDPCCGDPYCGDPCQGDPCCYDPCCGDPCCGDPNCGQECHTVCTQVCTTECTVWDDYGYCYWYEQVCDPPECHVECW